MEVGGGGWESGGEEKGRPDTKPFSSLPFSLSPFPPEMPDTQGNKPVLDIEVLETS